MREKFPMLASMPIDILEANYSMLSANSAESLTEREVFALAFRTGCELMAGTNADGQPVVRTRYPVTVTQRPDGRYEVIEARGMGNG